MPKTTKMDSNHTESVHAFFSVCFQVELKTEIFFTFETDAILPVKVDTTQGFTQHLCGK